MLDYHDENTSEPCQEFVSPGWKPVWKF